MTRREREHPFQALDGDARLAILLRQVRPPGQRLHPAWGRPLLTRALEGVQRRREVASTDCSLGEPEEGLGGVRRRKSQPRGLDEAPARGGEVLRIQPGPGEREHPGGGDGSERRVRRERLLPGLELTHLIAGFAGEPRNLLKQERRRGRIHGREYEVLARLREPTERPIEPAAANLVAGTLEAFRLFGERGQEAQRLVRAGTLAFRRQERQQRPRGPHVRRREPEQVPQRLQRRGAPTEREAEPRVLPTDRLRFGVLELGPQCTEQVTEGLERARFAVQGRELALDVELVRPLRRVYRQMLPRRLHLTEPCRRRRRAPNELQALATARGIRGVRRQGERGLQILEGTKRVDVQGELGATDARGHVGGLLLERLGEEGVLARRPLGKLGGLEEELRGGAAVPEQRRAAGEELCRFELVALREFELPEQLEDLSRLGSLRGELQRGVEPVQGAVALTRVEQGPGALEQQRRSGLGTVCGNERLGAGAPELRELPDPAGVLIERLEARGELVVQLPQRERLGVVHRRRFPVPGELTRATELGAHLRHPLGGRVTGKGLEHVLERAPGMLGPLAPQGQLRKLHQHRDVGGEARRLFERHQRLSGAAQAHLQHLRELPQRGGREPGVPVGLRHPGALLEREREATHVRALALDGTELAEGR